MSLPVGTRLIESTPRWCVNPANAGGKAYFIRWGFLSLWRRRCRRFFSWSGCGTYLCVAWIIQTLKQKLRTVSIHRKRSCIGSVRNVYVALRLILHHIQFITNICILCCPWHKLPSPRPIVMHLRPLVSVTMQPHCSLTARTHLHDAWPPQR